MTIGGYGIVLSIALHFQLARGNSRARGCTRTCLIMLPPETTPQGAVELGVGETAATASHSHRWDNAVQAGWAQLAGVSTW